MAISFNDIPANTLTPLAYVEFDNTGAVTGSQKQPYKVLVIGQKTTSGSATAEIPVKALSEKKASDLFGEGSQLARMAKFFIDNNKYTETLYLPLDDNGAGVAATGDIDFTVTGTVGNGIVYLYIGGQKVEVSVTSGDTADDIATATVAAIAAKTSLPVTAAVDGVTTSQVNFTAKNKGENGNSIDLRVNYYQDQELPENLSYVITAMASGTGNPDITSGLAALGDEWYNLISFPYLDSSNLAILKTELDNRFGPMSSNDGYAIGCKVDTFGNLSTFGGTQNSKYLVEMGIDKLPNLPEETSAAITAQVAASGAIDPARPFQTLKLNGILPPVKEDQFTQVENNLLLMDGIATATVNANNELLIQRLVTTYKTNDLGADDISYRDLNTLLTLSYIRYSWKNRILLKYPRHKLANDGTRFSQGQAVITPKILKAEFIALALEWEENGLVENADILKENLIVERNGSDPNRLDLKGTPDLINQFRVNGTQIAFIL